MVDAYQQQEAREPLERLVARLRPQLQQVLDRYRIPVSEAEDLMQEALLTTVQNWEKIQDPTAWLLTTLRYRCVVYWRRRRSRLYSAVDATLLELLAPPVTAPQQREELLWDLNQLLATLPLRCRQLLHLRYALGLEPREIAEQMGYRPASVRKLASRCIAALSEELLAQGKLGPLAIALGQTANDPELGDD
jgi:RNA polymerase sigma factor (sigma-70 family)